MESEEDERVLSVEEAEALEIGEWEQRQQRQVERIRALSDTLRVELQRRLDELTAMQTQAQKIKERAERAAEADRRGEKERKEERIIWLSIWAVFAVAALWQYGIQGVALTLLGGIAYMMIRNVFLSWYHDTRWQPILADEEALERRWLAAGNSGGGLFIYRSLLQWNGTSAQVEDHDKYARWQYDVTEHQLAKFAK